VLDQLALAESAGTRPFHATKCRAASSLLPPDEAVRKKSAKGNYEYDLISVAVDTLDAYCTRKKITMIDILKIDVQGAELGVLRGAQKILTENRIRLMYLEVIFADNYQGQSSLVPIAAFLEKFGYVLWDVRPFLFTRAGRLWTANALFTSGPSAEVLEKYPEEFPN
jgi:FkbM family methyltransferase